MTAGGDGDRVVAVVVAYDRRELLAGTLSALAAQTVAPAAVVVVDNASPDGSADLAAEAGADVLRLPTNTGGAGGFTAGIARALDAHGAGAVWLMDDDTEPAPDALERLLAVRRAAPPGTLLVASRVVWTDGRPHPMNTPRVRPWAGARAIRAAARHDAYPVRSASFVSLLVDAAAVRAHGLPVADYFLWNDDFEFTARLLAHGRGYVARASVAVHRTRYFGDTAADPGERFRFEVRNKLWLLTRSRALSPAERALYGGRTAIRWARTLVGASDRRTTAGAGLRGLREALAAGPRPAATVLAGHPGTARAVRRIEEGGTR